MSTYFIGCLHISHENMAKHRGFENSEEHDNYLIKQWNSVIKKKDKVYILGDVTMENRKHYHKLALLNGLKTVVLGNHDLEKDVPELLKYVDKVCGCVKYKGFIVTHIPVHTSELYRFKGNIHAHLHEYVILKNEFEADKRYIHTDAKYLDFKPISFEEINNEIK